MSQQQQQLLLDELIQTEDDLQFEEELLLNPYILKNWWNYIEYKRVKNSPPHIMSLLFERAVRALPGSYKLWFAYLQYRMDQLNGVAITDSTLYDAVNSCFERALATMHKMPRIWLEYTKFLIRQKRITQTRKVFDRSLQSLPVTQHAKIWAQYIKFVKMDYVPVQTGVCVMRRYVQQDTGNRLEEYIEFLMQRQQYDEAMNQLIRVLDRTDVTSSRGKSKYDFWLDICALITEHPTDIKTQNVEQIIRSGIIKYPGDVGQLWCALATYFLNMQLYEKARDVFEESMDACVMVKDFSLIFDAYAKFEEELVNLKVREADEQEPVELSNGFTSTDDVDMKIAKLEYLMDRRPLLLSSVKLRQNPHNVNEWHKRAKLFAEDPEKVVLTYSEAIQTVDPIKALGRPHTIWCAFAKYYEKQFEDLDTARTIFEKAVQAKFRNIDDLASVWCEYAEMEIRHKNFYRAKELLYRATKVPVGKQKIFSIYDQNEPMQNRLFKSTKLWSLYADLEESLGTFETTCSVYENMLDLKVATPAVIMNYARYLEERKYFEMAFKAYERGVALFSWPQVYHIWIAYLTKFVKRYGGKKLERTRDLFEQALKECPIEYAKVLFLLYAKYEEDHGLARHAMAIYDRATKCVKEQEQLEIFRIYINRASEFFGVTKTRDIYEKAINTLPEKYIKDMCVMYADLERKLGEIDRARAIFGYASRFCNPKTEQAFWSSWETFETQHGNVDTFKEMIRIRRSVEASFATNNLMAAAMMEAEKARDQQHAQKQQMLGQKRQREDALQALEEEAEKVQMQQEEEATEDQANQEEIELEISSVPTSVIANNVRKMAGVK